jgi:hypothetical protein
MIPLLCHNRKPLKAGGQGASPVLTIFYPHYQQIDFAKAVFYAVFSPTNCARIKNGCIFLGFTRPYPILFSVDMIWIKKKVYLCLYKIK